MGKKVLSALIAGGVLVGAGLVSSVISAPGTAVAQEDSESDDSGGPIPRIVGFLSDVLDDLVGDGTIDRSQADAIVAAAEDKAAEIKVEHRARHDQVRGFLDDGVITEDEASQLPDDHYLLSNLFDEAWADGELTRDEIAELAPHPRLDNFRRGFRFGALLDDGGITQEEYDALGDDHPLKQIDVSDYLEDGLITPDELREIHQDLMAARSDASA